MSPGMQDYKMPCFSLLFISLLNSFKKAWVCNYRSPHFQTKRPLFLPSGKKVSWQAAHVLLQIYFAPILHSHQWLSSHHLKVSISPPPPSSLKWHCPRVIIFMHHIIVGCNLVTEWIWASNLPITLMQQFYRTSQL